MQNPPTPHQTHRGLDTLLQTARALPVTPGARRFRFLRHGQTDGNRYKFFQPATQPLNERGLSQARQAAQILQGQRVARIFASDMTRTLQTAEAVARVSGVPVEPIPRLRERNFGELVGSSSMLIDWTCRPRDGETLEAFVLRVREGVIETLAGDDALLVAHGGTLHVLSSVLGVEIETGMMANALPLLFEREGKGWRVEALRPEAGDEEIALS